MHKYPGDLKTRKLTGNSFQIEIHFSFTTTKFLMKNNPLCFQIFIIDKKENETWQNGFLFDS